jgi:hypothetical protein
MTHTFEQAGGFRERARRQLPPDIWQVDNDAIRPRQREHLMANRRADRKRYARYLLMAADPHVREDGQYAGLRRGCERREYQRQERT